MYLPLIKHSKSPINRTVIHLPISDSDRQARLAIRIADSLVAMRNFSGMELTVYDVNACVRIGLVCMDQGSTLLGAHDHAVKVARRILLLRTHAERMGAMPQGIAAQPSEAGHG